MINRRRFLKTAAGLFVPAPVFLPNLALAQGFMFPGPGTVHSVGGGNAAWTTAFLARTSGMGGTETTAVTTMMNAMATAGLDAKCEIAHLMALSGTNGNLNLKSSSFTLTPGGSIPHTNGLGYTGNGAGTQWLDTGLAPASGLSVASLNSHCFVFFQANTADGDNGAGIGLNDASFANFVNAWDFGGNMNANVRSVFISGTVTNAIGMYTMSQTSSTQVTIYRNATQVTQNNAVSGQDASFSTGNVGYLGGPVIGTAIGPEGFAGMFSGLTAGDVTNLYSAVHTALNAINSTAYP